MVVRFALCPMSGQRQTACHVVEVEGGMGWGELQAQARAANGNRRVFDEVRENLKASQLAAHRPPQWLAADQNRNQGRGDSEDLESTALTRLAECCCPVQDPRP